MAAIMGFNSNVVRLKAIALIATILIIGCFNSNVVRLKGSGCPLPERLVYCFNSNVVRLKEDCIESEAGRSPFQFQCGAIKSMWVWFFRIPLH